MLLAIAVHLLACQAKDALWSLWHQYNQNYSDNDDAHIRTVNRTEPSKRWKLKKRVPAQEETKDDCLTGNSRNRSSSPRMITIQAKKVIVV
jgi:hypothetical protein